MHEGAMTWVVNYAGMRRFHQQEWQARMIYHYCLDVYQSDIASSKEAI